MFDDVLSILEGDTDLQETPVDVRTFVTKILNQPELSDVQYDMVEYMSQIYKPETLKPFTKDYEFHHRKYTKSEIVLQLGKGCHHPTTPVFDGTHGYWRPLNDMYGCDVVSSDRRSHEATDPFEEGSGPLFEVETFLGIKEIVTTKHKYYGYRRGKRGQFEYMSVGSLRRSDRVAVPLNYQHTDIKNIPLNHARLCGYWMENSRGLDNQFSITFQSDNLEAAEIYEELCASINDYPEKTIGSNYVRYIHTGPAIQVAHQYGLLDTPLLDRKIPRQVWQSDNEILTAFLSALYQKSATFVYHPRHSYIYYKTLSEPLAHDVQHAMFRVGMPARYDFFYKSLNGKYSVLIKGGNFLTRFFSIFDIVGKKHIQFDKPIVKNGNLNDVVYYDAIKSIRRIGEGSYWTMTVPETSDYIGNGLVSSNSGKDHTSTIAVAYIVYKLLCLKDPARYYGKPSGDPIDIINIAINAQQARVVFFNRFKSLIDKSSWFAGKYDARRDYIEFDKSVNVYSGHSERESHEGLNLLVAILDEISGFALESAAESGKSAQAIYDMFRASVDSRFPAYGKVVLLSFPRYEGDFITSHYDSVVASKIVVEYTHDFIIDYELSAEDEGNQFSIAWQEDDITAYTAPNVYALKKPTWKVNPTIDIESLKSAFFRNPESALARFACMPTTFDSSFFRYPDKLRDAFVLPNNITGRRDLSINWKPDPNREYYLHVDLAQQVDKCALAVSYVDHWQRSSYVGIQKTIAPFVITDLVAFWEPQREGPVDFAEVKQWILQLRRMGTKIRICTFDRWNSFDMIKELRAAGINSEILSVKKQHYEDFALLVYEERFKGPDLPAVVREMVGLRVIKDKVDHPSNNYKDLSDAVVGSVYNALRFATQDDNVIEIYDQKPKPVVKRQEIIETPVAADHVVDWLKQMRVI